MLEVDAVTHHYGDVTALSQVSFTVQANERVGLLGLNGAGKSTLIRILAGLCEPSAGSIRWRDRATGQHHGKSAIGYLPDTPPLFGDMRVGDFLRWCGQLRGRSDAQLATDLPEVVAACRLGDVEQAPIETLSFGYRKRVGLAQAFIHRPSLVLLDEAIAGLDPAQIVEMREMLRGLAERSTIVISSHILAEVSHTCDRVVILHNGRVVGEGATQDIERRVTAHAHLELRLRGEVEVISRAIHGISTEASIEWREREGALKRLELRIESAHREAVVAALVAAGVGVHGVNDAQSELESAFLRIVGGSTEGAQT